MMQMRMHIFIVVLAVEKSRMNITQLLYLIDRLSLADEFLLSSHDVVGGYILELAHEVGAYALHGLSFVDTPEQ